MFGLGATGEGEAIEADRAVAEPELDRLFELRLPARPEVDTTVDRQRGRVTARFGRELAQPGDAGRQVDGVEARDEQGHPPVGLADHAPQHGVGRSAPDQDRDLVDRQRVDPDAVEVVEVPLEIDDRLAPQLAHHVDLLFEDRRAVGEVDTEPFVLRRVPADTDRHSQPAATEEIDRRDLLGRQSRLALGQHQHARHELQRRRQGGEVAVQHQDLVERVLRRVRRGRERTERSRPESLR